MQITPDQLLDEAAHMALELRIKDRAIAALEAENARLQEALTAKDGNGHSHTHETPETAVRHPVVHGPDAVLDSTQEETP